MAQGSDQWLEFRNKKVTGTSLKSVRGAKWLEYADVIVSERVTGKRKNASFKSFSMDNGHVLEPFSRAAYEQFRQLTVTEVGFLQSDLFPNFGMSPDGVIFDGETVVGIVEIKCPEPQTHIRYIRQDKIPTEYDDQILSAFVVGDEVQFVDFVSFCPVIKSYPFFIKRARRADYEMEIAAARGALLKFFEQVDKMEKIALTGNGFIPSNLDDAIWEISDPEDLITAEETIITAANYEPGNRSESEPETWAGFTPPNVDVFETVPNQQQPQHTQQPDKPQQHTQQTNNNYLL